MKYVTLNSGVKIPYVGFGTWSLKGEKCYNAVKDALKVGYRLIDTASMYDNEEEVGRAIRDSGIAREEIFVITKLYPNQYKRARLEIEKSIKKLNIGYVDMMMLHHPSCDDVYAYKEIEQAIKEKKVRCGASVVTTLMNYPTFTKNRYITNSSTKRTAPILSR